VLVVADSLDAVSFDPAVAYEPAAVNLLMNVYDTLIRYDGTDFTHVRPALATSWDTSSDGLTWTFHLRHDARFSTGRPVDAQSVHDSLVRSLERKGPPAWILEETLAPERITVVDPYTLQCRLLKPCAYFLPTLYNPVAAAVDVKEVQQHPDYWMRDHSAGSGPFVLQRWETGVETVFERSPVHPEVPLRRIIVKDNGEPTMQQMMLERGDVDMAYDIPPLQTASLKADPHIQFTAAPEMHVWYLGMNTTMAPTDNPKVRQAIRCAIDYDGMVNKLMQGQGEHLEGPIISGMAGYAPHLGVYSYNPGKAKALLKETGVTLPLEITLTTGTGSTDLGPSIDDLCAKLQQDLAAVGINLKTQLVSPTAYIQMYRAGNVQVNLGYWGADFPDPQSFIQPFGHSEGTLAKRMHYKNPEVDRLIDLGATTLDFDTRDRYYKQAETLLAEDGPWAILVQQQKQLPLRREVQGFVWNPMSTCRKRPQDLAPQPRRMVSASTPPTSARKQETHTEWSKLFACTLER
jgi:peptide/nickel transport system substrate-binding protein